MGLVAPCSLTPSDPGTRTHSIRPDWTNQHDSARMFPHTHTAKKKKKENEKKCRLVRSRNRTLRSTKCTVHWMEYTLREGMEDSLWIWCMYACMQNLRERGCLPTSTLLSNNPHHLLTVSSYSYKPTDLHSY